MPYLIGVEEQDKEKLEDVIDRILNNELVVFTVYSDANNFSEAFTAHCAAILNKVDVTPSFGCVEVHD